MLALDGAHLGGRHPQHLEVQAIGRDELGDVGRVLGQQRVSGRDEEHVLAGAFQLEQVEQAGHRLARAGVVGVHHQVVVAQRLQRAHLVVEGPVGQAQRVVAGQLFGVGEKVQRGHDETASQMPLVANHYRSLGVNLTARFPADHRGGEMSAMVVPHCVVSRPTRGNERPVRLTAFSPLANA